MKTEKKTSRLRAGVVGLGYISAYHVKAIVSQSHADLLAVCDLSKSARDAVATRMPGVLVYSDLDKMLEEANLDVVHVLTQPDSHAAIAEKCLSAGSHTILEKPATTNLQEIQKLQAIAEEKSLHVLVNHNFIFSRPFLELRQRLAQNKLGPIRSVRVVWKKHLQQSDVGPWNAWMLRDPNHILWETGSHLFSELLTVLKDPVISTVTPQLPKKLPSGALFYRRWSINGTSDSVPFTIEISFDRGFEQHFIEVEGTFGVAVADVENEVLQVLSSTGHEYDLERLHLNARLGISRVAQAAKTFIRYVYSKLATKTPGGPFEYSLFQSIDNCYREIKASSAISGSILDFALKIAELSTASAEISGAAKASVELQHDSQRRQPVNPPKILLVGASGFIGKHLLQGLQQHDDGVRAIVRNATSLLDVPLGDNSEILVGNFQDQSFMETALEGIETVIHLAVVHANSYDGYLASNFEPTKQLVELCRSKNIKRFIYSGTIDSLYLGPGAGEVTETAGVDPKISRRNNYARSKAYTEQWLNEQFDKDSFPVVIVRPAIVLGKGGPIDHLGVAKWFGIGRCTYWGDGNHPLPFVLVDDVVDAVVKAIDAKGIEGKTYNLSSESMLSARDYVEQVGLCMDAEITTDSSYAAVNWISDLIQWVAKVVVGHADRKRIPSLRDWRCREQHAAFDTSAARTDLDWQPTSSREVLIRRGIRDVVDTQMELGL